MSEFKPMVKMYTDEPKVSLKLKKGGHVHHKESHKHHEEHGHKSMHHAAGGMMHGAHHAFEAEHGSAPKKPSMSERRKAMNPNQYAHGGKVAHKQIGGAMPMAAMARPAVAAMSPAARVARAAQVRRALTGMKKGGSADHKHIEKLEKELHHHEALSAEKAHGHKMHHKASGGKIDKAETRTTIEKGAKKFEHTEMHDGAHHDKAHGTKGIKDGAPAGYKHGGHAHKKHHKATGGSIPAGTNDKMNKGHLKFGETIEGNEHDFVNDEMHTAKHDSAHGTSGVRMSNAGGFKHGGKAHKMHHKATGGSIPAATQKNKHEDHLKGDSYEGGDWENRAADSGTSGVKNTRTGGVKEANAGGFKKGGHAKKHYATGGNVVDDGKAVKMPHHFVSRPVANSLQSGTFKKGGKVAHKADGGDMSGGAYDRWKQGEKEDNEAMRNTILGAPKRAYDAVKGMFSSTPSTPAPKSITKTRESVTVSDGKKRGGRASKC